MRLNKNMKELLKIFDDYSTNDDTRMAHAMLAVCRYAANRYYNSSAPLNEDDLSYMSIATEDRKPGEVFKAWCLFMSEHLCDECTPHQFVQWLANNHNKRLKSSA